MNEVKTIVGNIKKGIIAPIYFLMGEEPYFIDIVSDYIEEHVLQEDQKGFDQIVLYGQDVTVPTIIDYARRFPMMSDRQVIIVKEAQNLRATIDQLVPYVENPTPTTVLVFCYKYEKLDARKKLLKTLQKNKDCVLLESKKLYEPQVAAWLPDVLKKKHLSIQPKAIQMLVDFLGTDLSRIQNEVNKLALIVPENTEVTPDIIEKNIGISKEFNNFELKSAIAANDAYKVARILKHFADNPKDNPLGGTITVLYNYFQKLLLFHGLTDQSEKNVAAVLKESPYFIKEFYSGAQHYPMKRVSAIIATLRQIDLKSKGVGATNNLTEADFRKELIIMLRA
ncbi:DNA polymerase III subunit delta [Capnocytophaga genosp. AHN8471]|uniref:DNA polymerase III subunit delta n=1 Tax=Capnocytophaga genosp. AHN8471 TaxID=327574 RepID=UPI001931F396|nr:DNA polymerase III subunit delta [Capnocytophaga genosp. AHN8471]MBM0657914.1 DNA polymerase III subunit delta [Capnocytophaga genosp. AHN8471]